MAIFNENQFELEYEAFIKSLKESLENGTEPIPASEIAESCSYVIEEPKKKRTKISEASTDRDRDMERANPVRRSLHMKIKREENNSGVTAEQSTANYEAKKQTTTFKSFVRGKKIFIDRERR